MTAIDEIKNQIDIVDLVSETVKLRRTGKNYIGFCPFHSNTRTPAFVVFPDSGSWKCFGQCAEGGDIFNFLMKRDGLDFQQALETLAKRAGVELESYGKSDPARREAEKRLFTLMGEAADFYHNNLTQHPAGKTALQYLEKRGLTRETIDKYNLGYAPNSWDAGMQHLLSRDFSREELIRTGLVTEQRDEAGEPIPNGKIYDRFRNRITIPIFDSTGNPIAFGARILNPEDSPKFLNSPQTELFDKGKTLFGLNYAKRAIREKGQAVIVEGYMDVIVLHQAGFENTVSPMGTALTAFQVQQLARHSRRIILALDADAAGDHATLKGIDVMRSVLRTGSEGNGLQQEQSLISYENKLNADIRITEIPEGMDPDEVALRDPQEWQQILDNAKPIVIFMMETLAKGRDLSDGRTKSEIAEQVMPLIYEVANPIERETYRQQLARFLKIDESLLRYTDVVMGKSGEHTKKRTLPERKQTEKSAKLIFDPKASIYNKETMILRYLFHFYDTPGTISIIDRNLRQYSLPPLGVYDFEQSDLREIAACYFDGLEQDEELNTAVYIRSHISDIVADTFKKIEDFGFRGKLDLSSIDEELIRSIAYMRQEKCILALNELQQLYLEDEQSDNESRSEYEDLMNRSKRERKCLDKLLDSLNRIVFEKA